MLRTADELVALIQRLYPQERPRPFDLIDAALSVRRGTSSAEEAAKRVNSTRARMTKLAESQDTIAAVLHTTLAAASTEEAMRRPRAIVGQLLLGELAERSFVEIYRRTMGTDELHLEDDRISRSETDYRVLNGQRRPVFRINIKFFGTPFRKAHELVDLDTEDCFALATYKIHQGLLKQDEERLPYVFVIVGVPGLTGASVGQALPGDLAHLLAVVHSAREFPGKRSLEERVVAYVLDVDRSAAFQGELTRYKEQIGSAAWYALSARKADKLLRQKLFDRVYAVRVRAFARNYRNAELDMHFSLKQDLTLLVDFLRSARERGLPGLSVDLERGVI